MALKSGEMAGLSVSKSTYAMIGNWLDSVEKKSDPGTFAYHPDQQPTAAMTAEALLMRQYLGAKSNDRNLIAGADYLRMRLPRNDARDVYYWYYATQVMFHLQGEHWKNGMRTSATCWSMLSRKTATHAAAGAPSNRQKTSGARPAVGTI